MKAPAGSGIPFNLDDVVHRHRIEVERVEFKATWDEPIRPVVVRTVCAFANDLLNLNGGDILLGVQEDAGRPVLPYRGLDDDRTCFRITIPMRPLPT